MRPAPLSIAPSLSIAPWSRGLRADRGAGPSRRRTRSRVPGETRTYQGALRSRRAVEAGRTRRRFPPSWWSGAGTVEALTERECALAGAGDRGVPVDVLMSGPRVRRRRAAEGRIGARLGLARKSVGRGRAHPRYDRPLAPRLDRSRSTARRSCAICVPERKAHRGRQRAGATSTRLLATWATIFVCSSAAVLTRPHCGHERGDDRTSHNEYQTIPVRYDLYVVDLGSTNPLPLR